MLEDLCAGARQIIPEGQRQLLRVRRPAQASELRRQLTDFFQQALILAIEEQADLTERLDIAFLRQRHHAPRI
jgi:hypothetical protein